MAEQNHRQPSTSPVRAAAPASPSSSNASVRKKIVSFGIRVSEISLCCVGFDDVSVLTVLF